MDNNNNNSTADNILSIKDIWEIFVGHFWLFVASVAVCLALGVAYILSTSPVYERSASIMIKDNEQGRSISSQASQGFENLGLFQTNTNIINEINVLKTTGFMSEVVNRLGLEYTYKVRHNGLRWIDLYKSAPFKVQLDSVDVDLSFSLEFTAPNVYEAGINYANGEKASGEFTGKLGEQIETKYGKLTILATPLLVDSTEIVGNSYLFSKSNTKSTAKRYLEALTVILRSDDASIIDLKIKDENTERAENILNTLISVYNENWIKDKNEITFNTSGFIDERLTVIERELESVDGNIASYKSEKLLPDVAAVAGIQLQQTTNNTNEQLAIKNQLSMAHYIQGYLQNDNSTSQLLPANSGIDNNAIEAQISQYNELLLQKNMLLANSSEKNPLVADMIANLQSIKGVINTSINDHISTLTIQLSNLKVEEVQNKEKLSSTPRQAKELLSVERQQKIKEELFLYLLQKREENELSQAFSAYNTKILSLADGAPAPVEPRKIIILFFAMMLGFALPVLYLILKTALNTTVSNKKDLAELSQIPFIGSLPRIAPSNRRDKDISGIVVSEGNRDVTNEAFRVIRTNIDFINSDRKEGGAHVIQVISMNPGSGKTFITSNLATSMALKDSKVLLIDADIRKATLSALVGTPKFGFSDYLSGRKSDINQLIMADELFANLDILPVGIIPPNPSELLLKPRFAELVSYLRTQYDYIFFDCPPTEVVPDAAIISKVCDTAIYVIRAGKFDKRLLPDLKALYESKKYNNMCILLNDVRYSGKGYYGYRKYGYYGYGSGYGYGYGYGNDKK